MRLALASLLLLMTGCSWFSTKDDDFIIPPPPPALTNPPPSQRPDGGPSYSGTFNPDPIDTEYHRTSTLPYADVRAGELYTCARTARNEIDCWGKTPNDPQHTAAEIAVRDATVCVLDAQGKVTCWGDTTGYVVPEAGPLHGLGLGHGFACALDATNHPQCWGPAALAAPDDVELKKLAVGWGHACGLRVSDGKIVCWGSYATESTILPPESFDDIAAGGLMTCATDASGYTQCWGDFRDNVPHTPFKQVAVGNGVACGIPQDGDSTVCWGNDLLRIKQVPAQRYSQISIGTDHACAIRAVDSKIECWGSNANGQSYPP